MNTTDAIVKLQIAQYLPADVAYVRAHPIESGKGLFRKRTQRRIGTTRDSFFSVELHGRPDNVHRLLFLSLADTPPLMLARSLTAVRGVIDKVLPDWKEWDALIAELQQGKDVTIGPVKAHYQLLTTEVRVLFVSVG